MLWISPRTFLSTSLPQWTLTLVDSHLRACAPKWYVGEEKPSNINFYLQTSCSLFVFSNQSPLGFLLLLYLKTIWNGRDNGAICKWRNAPAQQHHGYTWQFQIQLVSSIFLFICFSGGKVSLHTNRAKCFVPNERCCWMSLMIAMMDCTWGNVANGTHSISVNLNVLFMVSVSWGRAGGHR